MDRTSTFLFIPLLTQAHPCKDACKDAPTSPWDGTNAQIGYTKNSGNTNNSILNLGLNLTYKKPRWQNIFLSQFQYGKDSGAVNRVYTHLNNQTQFNFKEKPKKNDYIFLTGDAIITRFGPYSYQNVLSAGWGRRWINTKYFLLSGQIGPGYRISKIQNTNSVEYTPLGALQANMSLTYNNYGTLTQSINYDIAKPYNYLQAVTAFTNKIVAHIAVQVSYTITYYSEIPAASTNTKKWIH